MKYEEVLNRMFNGKTLAELSEAELEELIKHLDYKEVAKVEVALKKSVRSAQSSKGKKKKPKNSDLLNLLDEVTAKAKVKKEQKDD